MNQLVTITNGAEYRQSTDAAGLCREIVKQTAKPIQGRRYVSVEGWQAIAIAHGCTASADNVERVDDEGMSGFKCTGIVRRMSDGAEISRAEGFLGDDEQTWSRRPVYARRAMVQTRAISRACRSAFAHVVVMIDAGLSTTPAEEVPHDGFDEVPHRPETGEIIDAQAIPVKEPAAREKLDGLHTSKTALRKAIVEVIGKIRAAQSQDEVSAIVKDNKASIDQAKRDWPALIDGDPNIPEDIGLRGTLAQRKAELAEPAEDGQYKMLIESMKGCASHQELADWTATNASLIEELDGPESRSFQLAYDLYASGLKAVATVAAG